MSTPADRKAEATRLQQLTELRQAEARARASKEHTITLKGGTVSCYKSFNTSAALHYVSNLVENGVEFTYKFE